MMRAWTITAAAMVAALTLAGCQKSDDEGPLSPENPSIPAYESSTPTPSETATADPENPDDPIDAESGLDVADRFVEAYNAQSHNDDTPNTWYFAIEEYMTADGYQDITDGIDPEDGGQEVSDWEKGKTVQWATPTSTDWIPGYKHSPETMSVYVVFTLNVKDKNYPYEVQDTMYLDMKREGDEWKVAEINNSKKVRNAVGGSDEGHEH